MNGFEEALRLFRENDRFILTTHEGPDADGIGAEVALSRALRALEKSARVVNADSIQARYAFLDPENILERFDEAVHGAAVDGCVLVVLDSADLFNLGVGSDLVAPRSRSVFAIDHHERPKDGGIGGYLEPAASSTCELVVRIIQALGAPIDAVTARAAFSGIVYDTGSFIYPKTSASTFKTALALVEAGAIPTEIYRAMYESASVGALILQKLVLSSLELHGDGRIAIQTMLKTDLERAGAGYEEVEPLINIPLRSKDVEVSILFKESPEGRLRCSLRSKGRVNVSLLAQGFGGGGHRTAAGFKCSRGLAETKDEVLQKVLAALEAAPSGVKSTPL